MSNCVRILDPYLRVISARPKNWLAAFREIMGVPDFQLNVESLASPLGDIASLETAQGVVSYFRNDEGLRFHGSSNKDITLVMVHRGFLTVRAGAFHCQAGAGGSLLLAPGTFLQVDSAGPLEVVVIQLTAAPSLMVSAGVSRYCSSGSPEYAMVSDYLWASRYFFDHENAVGQTQALLSGLRECLSRPGSGQPAEPAAPRVEDYRVCKAVSVIRNRHGWRYHLPELASCAGASERNLYYLMKAETGMTPYRFYQRSRLLRVREQLVRCEEGAPSISRYAMNEGFSHLGRFAALYRDHFGELPSETLAWRLRLLALARELEPGACRLAGAQLEA